MNAQHVTVEQTKKKYKFYILCSVLMIVGSFFHAMVVGDKDPLFVYDAIMFLLGIISYIVTKIIVWWNHG